VCGFSIPENFRPLEKKTNKKKSKNKKQKKKTVGEKEKIEK
jgi:hypothetical protein